MYSEVSEFVLDQDLNLSKLQLLIILTNCVLLGRTYPKLMRMIND